MSGFVTTRTARQLGRFKVQERVYTTRADGSRVLKYAKGKEISFDEAIAQGLVDPDHVPAEAIQAILPRDVYENGRLVGRAGKVVSLADLERYGFMMSEVETAAKSEGEGEPDDGEPSSPAPDAASKKVRTTKVPAPEV